MRIGCNGAFRGLLAGLALAPSTATAQYDVDDPPTVWGYATPSRIVADVGTVVVHWGSSGADYCSYAGTRYATSGSARLGPYPAGEHSFTFSCFKGSEATDHTIRWTAYVPPPVVSASVSPAGVYTGQTATLRWSSTYADSCSRGGTSGAETVGPWDTAGVKTVSVTCTGPGGRGSDSATVTVSHRPPDVSASIWPTTVYIGQIAFFRWSSTYATGCTRDGARVATGGSATLSWQTAGVKTVSVICTGPGGEDDSSVTVTVRTRPPFIDLGRYPAVIEANVRRFTITWTTSRATSCAHGGRSVPTSGSLTLGPYAPGSYSETLACTGPGGTTSRIARWKALLPPTVDSVTVSPASVTAGTGTATLRWTSTNADSCSRDGVDVELSDFVSVGPFRDAGTRTFEITCANDLRSASRSAVLTVVDPPPVTVRAWTSPSSVTAGAGTTLRWTSTNADSCSHGARSNLDASGFLSVGPFTRAGTRWLTVTCRNAATSRSGNGYARLTVSHPPRPTVTASISFADPVMAAGWSTATLSWESENAASCSHAGETVPVDGSITVGPFAAGERTLTVTCRNASWSESDSVAVTPVAPPVSPPPPLGFDPFYRVKVGAAAGGRAVMLVESLHPDAYAPGPGMADFVVEFLNGEAGDIVSPPPQADVNLATIEVAAADIRVADINFDGPRDLLVANLSSYIDDALDVAVFGVSGPNRPPSALMEKTAVAVNFAQGIVNYINAPAETNGWLDDGGQTVASRVTTTFRNGFMGCYYGAYFSYHGLWVYRISHPGSLLDWQTNVLGPIRAACEAESSRRDYHGTYTVTTTETAFTPLSDIFTSDELAMLRAVRTAMADGGFASGGAEVRAAGRALGNVMGAGVVVGDLDGGDVDVRISNPAALAALITSDVLGDQMIGTAADARAEEDTGIDDRREMFEDFDLLLETTQGAIATDFFAAAAADAGGLRLAEWRELFNFLHDGDGGYAGPGLSPDAVAFLRKTTMALSYIYAEAYLRLVGGRELEFADGERGGELADSLVEYKETVLQHYIDNPGLTFAGDDASARMTAVTRELGDAPGNFLDAWLVSECVDDARDNAFPDGDFDFAVKADRVSVSAELASLAAAPGSDC